MSQAPGPSQGGSKATREKRRLSTEQPFKRAMPATRHSPYGHGQGFSTPSSPIPISDI